MTEWPFSLLHHKLTLRVRAGPKLPTIFEDSSNLTDSHSDTQGNTSGSTDGQPATSVMEAGLVGLQGSHNGVQTFGSRYAAGQSVQGQGGQGQGGRAQSSQGKACQKHGAPGQVGRRQSIEGQGGQGRHGAVGGVNCRRGRYSMNKISAMRGEEVLPSPKSPMICHI